jgi:hypothetical protein
MIAFAKGQQFLQIGRDICVAAYTRGGFVMFSVQSNMKTAQARDVTKEKNLAGFRKAALVAVSQ